MRLCPTLLVVVLGSVALPQGQSAPATGYVAFRVDDQHLIATVLVREAAGGQVREGLSPRPAARYGYPYFTIPSWWQDRPFAAPPLGRWMVHLSPDAVIEATAEEAVGGYAQCQEAVGVLLRATPENTKKLAASAARYFVASPIDSAAPLKTGHSSIGGIPLPPPSRWKAAVEAALDDLLARELPRARSESELSKMEASSVSHIRSWARDLRRVETAMERNEGRREYDVQAFRLGPADTVYFVRAEWLVQGRQGFAASLWLRTEPRLEVIEENVRPAAWLRMFEFQGRVSRENLGMVLNVFDRDRDGWGEILFLETGYESFSISLRRYSPSGLVPTGRSFDGGC